MRFSEGYPKGVRFHEYNYGNHQGFVEEGIYERIRQGVGGPGSIEAGAEVQAHAHISASRDPEAVKTVILKDNTSAGIGKRFIVGVNHITGFPEASADPTMIKQDDPNVTGVDLRGIVLNEEMAR